MSFKQFTFSLQLILFSGLSYAEDWPHFMGQNYDLHSSETGLKLDFTEQGPAKLWEFSKGKGNAAPVVDEKHAYLFHQIDSKEVVTCLAVKDGSTQWQHGYAVDVDQAYGIIDTPRSSPTLDIESGLLFTLGNDSDLHAIDTETGKVKWHKKLTDVYGEAPFFFGQGSSLLVYQQSLIVHVGTNDACVVALDLKTGKEIWKMPHQWNGSYASPIVTKINNQDCLLVFASGKTKPPHGGLIAINPKTGDVHDSFFWRSKTFASVNAATPIACGENKVFITADYGCGGVMLQFDAQFKMTQKWAAPEFGCQFQTPIYHDGILYGITGSQGLMQAYDADSGESLWQEDFQDLTLPWQGRDLAVSLGRAHMIWVQDQFLCLTENGQLLSLKLDRKGPIVKSKATLFYAPETWAPPVISHGRLYINQNEFDRRLICYDLRGS